MSENDKPLSFHHQDRVIDDKPQNDKIGMARSSGINKRSSEMFGAAGNPAMKSASTY